MSVAFSPKGGNAQRLCDLMSTAKSTLDIAIYSFTNSDIANAVLAADKRGVIVRVVMDKNETHGEQATIYDQLEAAGVNVKVYSPPRGIMHNKFTIVDELAFSTGSFNYTNNAENYNYENLLILSSSGDTEDIWIDSLIQDYEKEFNLLWTIAQPEPQGLQRSLVRFFRSGMPTIM